MARISFAEQSKLRCSQMISFLSHHDDDGFCLKQIHRAVTPHIMYSRMSVLLTYIYKFWSSTQLFFQAPYVVWETKLSRILWLQQLCHCSLGYSELQSEHGGVQKSMFSVHMRLTSVVLCPDRLTGVWSRCEAVNEIPAVRLQLHGCVCGGGVELSL